MKYLLIALACSACIEAFALAPGSDRCQTFRAEKEQVNVLNLIFQSACHEARALPQDEITTYFDFSFSKDGSLMAFQLPERDSEWRKVVIMHVTDRSIPDDTLADVIFSSLRWKGSEGVFYNRYDIPGSNAAMTSEGNKVVLYYHKLGTPQSADKLNRSSVN